MEFANKHPYILPNGEGKEGSSDIIVIGHPGEKIKVSSTKEFYTDIFNAFATHQEEGNFVKRVVEVSPVILNRLKILNGNQEFKESPLEETAAESEVDRVIQLAKEMR